MSTSHSSACIRRACCTANRAGGKALGRLLDRELSGTDGLVVGDWP
jgi:hypothetical protein